MTSALPASLSSAANLPAVRRSRIGTLAPYAGLVLSSKGKRDNPICKAPKRRDIFELSQKRWLARWLCDGRRTSQADACTSRTVPVLARYCCGNRPGWGSLDGLGRLWDEHDV